MIFYDDFSCINGRYKQIKDFEDYYITEFGEVYSTIPIGVGKEHKLHKIAPKNPGRDDKYYSVVLCNRGKQSTRAIHRLVAEYFVDGYFDGAVVNHIDGDNRNNVASNLEWTTVADNVRKSYETSGVGATRNYLKWTLYDPDGNKIDDFIGQNLVKKYVKENNLDCFPASLVKYGESNGYRVTKADCKL